eukprot:8442546-Alexandrium_andersonii.AAC.1
MCIRDRLRRAPKSSRGLRRAPESSGEPQENLERASGHVWKSWGCAERSVLLPWGSGPWGGRAK